MIIPKKYAQKSMGMNVRIAGEEEKSDLDQFTTRISQAESIKLQLVQDFIKQSTGEPVSKSKLLSHMLKSIFNDTFPMQNINGELLSMAEILTYVKTNKACQDKNIIEPFSNFFQP